VAGGDRRLQRVGALRAAQRLGARQRAQAAADQQLVPACAVLLQQTDRFAKQGYVALAVDLYRGKSTKDPGEAHELMRGLERARRDHPTLERPAERRGITLDRRGREMERP